ncbi:hypothetical protein CUU64_10020, partial [Bacillus sp. V5-8f]
DEATKAKAEAIMENVDKQLEALGVEHPSKKHN